MPGMHVRMHRRTPTNTATNRDGNEPAVRVAHTARAARITRKLTDTNNNTPDAGDVESRTARTTRQPPNVLMWREGQSLVKP